MIVGDPRVGDAFQLFFNYPNAGQTHFEFCGHVRGACQTGTNPNIQFTNTAGVTVTYQYQRVDSSGAVHVFASGEVDLSQHGTTQAIYTY